MSKFQVTSYHIRKRKSLTALSGTVRIAVLADVHNNPAAGKNGELSEQIRRWHPDAVFCCGDILTAKAGIAKTENALCLMRDLAGCYPVYYVNGNHESRIASDPGRYGKKAVFYFEQLEADGVRFLNNDCCLAGFGGCTVRICGYEAPLPYYNRRNPVRLARKDPQSILTWKPDGMDGNNGSGKDQLFTVWLAHHPDLFPAYAAAGADLVLSGHVHGGMVRLPFFGGLVGATLKPLPPYDKGRFVIPKDPEDQRPYGRSVPRKKYGDGCTERECEMIVSAGLGDHTIPLRVNNPTELVMLEIG